MTDDTITSFLTYYIRDLRERTRKEVSGAKYGFDWIIYNLGLALGWKPVRLPWLRAGAGELSPAKTEAEFGIDLSFLTNNGEKLIIFVLKDEVLSYKNWTGEGFDSDLRRAAAPDLRAAGLTGVKEVEVILAYNKDEDQRGIDSFDNTVRALGSKIGDTVALTFGRWNLTEITDRVRKSLLTPSLLPQNLFAQFSYVCAQVDDFPHGSNEWMNQLVPNWRRFLAALIEPVDLRLLRLVPVLLVILREHGKPEGKESGWLDLCEWAMLSVWRAVQKSGNAEVRVVAQKIWTDFYLNELEQFYVRNQRVAQIEHGLQPEQSNTYLDPVAASFLAFWHTGRLGLLHWAIQEALPTVEEERQKADARLEAVLDMLNGILMNNPGALRPVIDIQHIELFLIWRAHWTAGQITSISGWIVDMGERLLMRRLDKAQPDFISGSNSWEIVLERAAGERDRGFGDSTSNLLLMILEFISLLTEPSRSGLLRLYFLCVVRGVDEQGASYTDSSPLDLMSWAPPADWSNRVLENAVFDGIAIPADFDPDESKSDLGLTAALADFAKAARQQFAFTPDSFVPASVFALACLKHRCPIPPDFWRNLISGAVVQPGTGAKAEKTKPDEDKKT